MNVHRLKVVNPTVKWKVGRAKPYGGRRQALTQGELDRLFATLKDNRHGHRDYMIALVTFLHGLRVSELIDLRWDDVDWRKGTIAIRRLKGINRRYPLPRTGRGHRPEAVATRTRTQATAYLHQRTWRGILAVCHQQDDRDCRPERQDLLAGASALPAAYHRDGAGQRRHGRLAIVEADGPRLDRQHDEIRSDVAGTVEGCMAGQTLTIAGITFVLGWSQDGPFIVNSSRTGCNSRGCGNSRLAEPGAIPDSRSGSWPIRFMAIKKPFAAGAVRFYSLMKPSLIASVRGTNGILST